MIKVHQDIVLSIDKLDGVDNQFVKFTLEESALGPLPKAVIVTRSDQDLVKLLDDVHVKITDPKGNVIEGDFYVYEIGYVHNTYTIKLMSQNHKFTREIHTNKFTNMKNAVQSLYPAGQVTNTDTDLLNDIKIFQMQETDYKLVERLLHAWKKNTIFGFAIDGLRILDLNNYQGTDAYKEYLGDTLGSHMVDDPKLTEPKLYGMDTKFVDYSGGVDPNHVYVSFNKNYIPVNKDLQDLIGNMAYNQRFATTKNVFNAKIRTIIPLALCQGVIFPNKESNIEELYVSSRTIMIDTNTSEIDYTLRTINP